ncbi:AraC family transcriptional regulator [Curtobacterium sp. MCSS17_011]|nr:AraC family transcriptional regulator [Curtobacterium sp. MCSS17_011]
MLRDGFPGERLHVLPRPLVGEALKQPLTERLLVTDAGYFPHAEHHGRRRPQGARELIVILVSDGVGWIETPKGRVTVSTGQVVLLPPGTPHSYGADSASPWSIWWFHATGADAGAHLDSLQERLRDEYVLNADAATVAPLFEAVVAALSVDETRASLLAASGAAWHVLAVLGTVAAPSRGTSTHSAIESICEYLRQHLEQPTKVPALARRAQLSASHFRVVFRRTTGVSVVEYVRRLRMARARFLLEATDLSIAEVAASVGYDDPFYFSRQFRTVVGLPPSQFREHSRRSETGARNST